MPTTIDPMLADAIGTEVHVAYVPMRSTPADPIEVKHLYGRLGVVLAGDLITELVIETDGGAAFVALAGLLKLEGAR